MNCWTPVSRIIRHAVIGRPVRRVRRAWSGPAVIEVACKRSASAIAALSAGAGVAGGTLGAAAYAAAQYGGSAGPAPGSVVLGSGLSASALQAELGSQIGGYTVPAAGPAPGSVVLGSGLSDAAVKAELGYQAGSYSVPASGGPGRHGGSVVAVSDPGRPVAVPEPASSAVLCVALAATLLIRRFK